MSLLNIILKPIFYNCKSIKKYGKIYTSMICLVLILKILSQSSSTDSMIHVFGLLFVLKANGDTNIP